MALTANMPPQSGPTPPSDDRPATAYATYLPRELNYSANFEDSLIAAVLNPSSLSTTDQGIRVISDDSNEKPIEGKSVRLSDISLESLPTISDTELPLPLNDPRRIFASAIPGIKLTHPGGYLEGGPGLEPDMDTFPEHFMSTHGSRVHGAEDLRREVQKEVDRHVEELKGRLSARQKAKARNEQIEKDLKALVDQHGLEMKSLQKMAVEAEKKKVAREKRKKDREG